MKKSLNLEQIFVSALKSNQRLKWYLQYNINLVNYLDSKWGQYTAFFDITFALIPREKKKEVIGDISSERILKILEKERPDLFKTLNTQRGLVWLEQQIVNFKKRFL